MPDGLPSRAPEPLRVVKDGVKYGVAGGGKLAWLPPEMWASAAELVRRMDAINAEQERLNMLIRAAQDEADAAGDVQTAWAPDAR